MKPKWDPDHVTIPDPGDLLFPKIPVEELLAYSVGRLPDWVADARGLKRASDDDETRVRVAQVKVDGQWVAL